MLEKAFEEVYNKFKLNFYKKVFEKWNDREASLTTVESFCMEVIYGLGNPTIAEFAKFISISSPNAAYKVNNLIKKGYVEKIQSPHDKREYHLKPTEKYMNYYNISYSYIEVVMKRIRERFSKEQVDELTEILRITADELMPEISEAGKAGE